MSNTLTGFDPIKGKSAWPPDPTLILTMGLPYSGKSTWAREQVKLGAAIVCPDSIRLAIHGYRFIKSAENYVWTVARTMVDALFHAGHNMVIVDACSISKSHRYRWFSSSWTTRLALFDVSPQTCKFRAIQLGDQIILPFIEQMSNEWEEPSPPEEIVEILIMEKHQNARNATK